MLIAFILQNHRSKTDECQYPSPITRSPSSSSLHSLLYSRGSHSKEWERLSFVVSTHALLLIFFSHCSNNPIEYSFEVNQFPLFQFEAQKEETRATPFFSLSLSLELSASSCLSFACLLHFPFHTCFNLYHSPPEGVVGSNTYCLRSPSFARCIYVTL